MSDWRDGYNKALRDFLLRKGGPVQLDRDDDKRPNYYGWVDYDVASHFRPVTQGGDGCVATVEDDAAIVAESHSQFMGTFYEGSEFRSFLIMRDVRCECGKHEHLIWGYQGEMGDVLKGVLNDG